MKGLCIPQHVLDARLVHGFFDDFQGFKTAESANLYTLVTAVDGTATLQDAAGGRVAVKSAAATAGDEDAYLAREPEGFLMAASKPLKFGARVQATEDDVNQNNLFVGLADGVAADLLVSAGAGPKTSGSMLAFFKVDGGLNWKVIASLGATQTIAELNAVNSLDKQAHVGSGSAFQLLEIEFHPKNSTQADVIFLIDGVPVYKITDFVFTSATEMQAVFGAKDGDSSDETTIVCDYWYCYQAR